MVTGFNTDVEFNGRIYHVQTEDRGVDNPIIESLVYTGGEIVTSRKSSYAELLSGGGEPPADAVQGRMETQHRELMREIRNGAFASGALKPFGHGIVTNRSFDEVVAEFLAQEPRPETPVAAAAPAEPAPELATAAAGPGDANAASPRRRVAKRKRSAKRS